MYLNRIGLRADRIPGHQCAYSLGDAYAAHQLVWRFFSRDDDHKRDFLYRFNDRSRWPEFLCLSKHPAQQIDDQWDIDTKEFSPRLSEGQRLRFSLRVNPIRTRHDEAGKHKRHDVIMDFKRRQRDNGVPWAERKSIAQIVTDEGFEWLVRRGEACGFITEKGAVIAGRYQQVAMRRGKRDIQISTLDFDGVLTVSDVELFKACTTTGIGPAKAFGCGLMLIAGC